MTRYVYIISMDRFIKIGISKNSVQRADYFAAQCCPVMPVLVAQREFSDAKAVEKKIHAVFRADRLNGEWFNGRVKSKAVRYLFDVRG